MILSTGAGPVVPFALVGRLFFGTRVVFVETITRIERPSLTGRIMYYLAHDFFYQWEGLRRFFPKGRYGGAAAVSTFVSVGNATQPFARLLDGVAAIARELPQPVFVQSGSTPFHATAAQAAPWLAMADFESRM